MDFKKNSLWPLIFLIVQLGADSNIFHSGKPDSSGFPIKIIKGWQKISYSTSLLNCQFDPCCSNYSIKAIQQKGFFKGLLICTDRICRCHPLAFRYYNRNRNGRLSDPLSTSNFSVPYNAYTVSTAIVATAVPGTHKMLNHRFFDGFTTFVITTLSGYATYHLINENNKLYIPYFALTTTLYLSDVYSNIRSFQK